MTLEFSFVLPESLRQSVCRSGQKSLQFDNRVYLILKNEDEVLKAFEIFYEYHCSPFKQAEVHNNLLVVGHENYFYLYDLMKDENLSAVELGGYFGSFRIDGDAVFVCDAHPLGRLN